MRSNADFDNPRQHGPDDWREHHICPRYGPSRTTDLPRLRGFLDPGSNRNSVASASLILIALMRRKSGQRGNARAPALRRLLIMFLAAAYLMVGFAGEVSCAEETLPAAASLDASAGLATTDEGSKKTPTVVEHCYTCAPVVMPVLVPVAEPSAEPVKLSFEAPTFLLEDHPGLDTPPPKYLT